MAAWLRVMAFFAWLALWVKSLWPTRVGQVVFLDPDNDSYELVFSARKALPIREICGTSIPCR